MPSKTLTSQTDRKGNQDIFKFGGGKNTIFANDDVDAFGNGSGYGYIINGGGGDDTIFGSDFTGPPAFPTGTIVDNRTLNGDLLIGGDGSDIVVGGLGNDTIFGGNEGGSDKGKGKGGVATNKLIGDGGFDATDPTNILLIDSLTVDGAPDGETGVSAPSYDDKITGGDASNNDIYGDYVNVTLTGNTTVYVGGSDTLKGGNNDDGLLFGDLGDLPQNNIYGDAEFLTLGLNTKYTGGVDIISGGTNADNSLYGDVFQVTFQDAATFKGGDDVITGGNSINGGFALNDLYGDAQNVNFNALGGTAEGGKDTLISGTNANDVMHGDFVDIRNPDNGTVIGGADTFVFGVNNGQDTIKDFEVSKDKINLFDTGLASFTDLAGHISEIGGDTIIDLGQAIDIEAAANVHTVTIEGVAGLLAGDFEFGDWMA